MTDNDVGDEGAKGMSEMLKVNTTVASLNLCSEKKRKDEKKREMKDKKNG